MAGQCLDRNRESVLAVRIAEVSKNHLNQVREAEPVVDRWSDVDECGCLQRFRVQVAVPKCPGACDYETAVVTDPVLVLSKKKKRPVKQNADAASPATAKKAKRASMHTSPTRKMTSESPDSSQSSSTVTGSLTAALAEMEDTTPSRTTESMAPFTPDSPNLCLWANAAFDLLHNLQWQRVLTSATDKSGGNLGEILSQALSKAYKCPSCQETYGQVPTHKDDCDLKLLLEQGGRLRGSRNTCLSRYILTRTESLPGIPEASATGKVYDLTTNHSNQWPADTELEWPDRPKVMYSGGDTTPKVQTPPYNLSRNLLQLSADRTGRTQAPTNAFNSNVAASTLNVNSWKDYASLSKLLYRCSHRTSAADNSTFQWTGALPPVGTLTSGVSTFPSAAKSSGIMQARAPRESQQFSALLAATKGMSADAADLFREAEAALNGDGNIVNSLSNLSVSDLMRPNIGDNDDNEIRFAHKAISLSGLLSADQPVLGISVEREVAVIMASDFRDCGFPAFDASFNSLGFYHLLTATVRNAFQLKCILRPALTISVCSIRLMPL
ncbi:unnamed protein product [Phytophthora lilii]|uniref:Unnamed protein product n=1 Tax=Phytophthora lilii TaxID=2077276 RepID=A0A9W6U8N3_9STRA|nr:unnamed protein product [Phytophthora lilii]